MAALGYGIFGLNNSFISSRNFEAVAWQTAGYLSEVEWAFILALLAVYQDDLEPEWLAYVSSDKQKLVRKCIAYIDQDRRWLSCGVRSEEGNHYTYDPDFEYEN